MTNSMSDFFFTGTVFSTFHVLMGKEVAIEREMPKVGKPDEEVFLVNGESVHAKQKESKREEICLLPYKAQVYWQLRGYQAIPSLHPFEMYSGGYFLILDKVSVTLEHLRKVCRGTLSLRTVVILALEMVNTFCALFVLF